MNILASAMEEYLDLSRGIAVREDLLREKRDLIKRILRAQTKARRYILENERGSSEVLADYVKVELPVALESYRLARPAFTTDGIPTEEEVREYLKTESEAMGLPKPVPADRIFDFSLQREVNRELGIRYVLTALVVGNNKEAVIAHNAFKTHCKKRISEIKGKKATPIP